jgi:hypothetical protein
MDYANEQKQELDALESIFPNEYECVCSTYPNIEINIHLQHVDDNNGWLIYIPTHEFT